MKAGNLWAFLGACLVIKYTTQSSSFPGRFMSRAVAKGDRALFKRLKNGGVEKFEVVKQTKFSLNVLPLTPLRRYGKYKRVKENGYASEVSRLS